LLRINRNFRLTDEEVEELEALDAQAVGLSEVPVEWSNGVRCRKSAAVLLDWLTALDQPTLLDFIAYGVAATVKPECDPHIDRLAFAARLGLARWWTPNAKGYFSRMSKTQIAEAVTEA
jgi:hypothetical protein